MTIVADVLATFRGDTSDLEASANRANAVVGGIGDKAGSIAPAFAEGSKAASDLAEKVSASATAMDEMGDVGSKALGGFRNAIIPIIGAAGLGGLLDMAKNTTMELQTLGVQFNAVFGGSGSSALKSAISDANTYGVSITAAASAYQGLGLVTKASSQDIQTDMKAAADGAAGLGLSIDSVSGMLTNYYQLVQRVGGTGGTANRAATALLTSNLIDPNTANQLRVQANQGANAQSLLDIINSDIESRFGGAGKKQADTLGGQLQIFRNQFSDNSASALSPIVSGMQSGLTDINKDMSSTGFKEGVQDLTGFIGAMTKGVSVIEPFAKDVAEMALETGHFVTEIKPVGEVIGVVVAALLAWQAIKIVQDLSQTVLGVRDLANSETGLLSSLTSSTAAMEAQTAAAEKMFAVMVAGGSASPGVSMGGVGGNGLLPVARSSAPSDASASPAQAGLDDAETSTMMTKTMNWMGGAGAGIVTLVGSQLIGHMVGGSAGNAISSIGGMAGTGAILGSMAGPEGTVIGAGLGATVGLVQTAFQTLTTTSTALTDAMQKQVSTFDETHKNATQSGNEQYQHIESAHTDATNAFTENLTHLMNGGYNTANNSAVNETMKQTAGALYNANQNLESIATKNGLSVSQSEQFAGKNNIDLSMPLAANIDAIDNATTALRNLGGSAEFSAEQVSSAYNTIASQVSGQYGETSANAGSLINQLGKAQGLTGSQSQSQFFSLGQQAGVDFGTMGITPQSLNSTTTQLPGGGSTPDITPQEAQLKNQMLQVTLQYTQALQGEQEAEFAVGQAAFSVTQAYFSQSQAVFSAEQAMFSFGRAILANTVAQVTQQDASAATATALTSGYLPANANVAAALAQVTSLTTAQVTAINAEVASYNTLENAMYGSINGAQSLFAQYTMLNGAVQTLQAQTQQYQQLLNEPLAGSEQYSQQQEQYKVQEAAIQQQIDQLELQRVPTDDPRVKTLQAQLALLQSQADLSTQINTQGVGQQQFQIQQAQLGPQQSFSTEMGAATAMGQLNVQLLAAQQALDPVNTSYIALNAQLTVAQQRNSAVTGALQTQATADQGVITANNGLITAANGVTTAQNGLVTAANAVKTAQENQTTAQWGLQSAVVAVQTATNTFASTLQGNIATALTEIQGFITNIGTSASNTFQALSQSAQFAGEEAAASLAGNSQLAGEYQTLLNMISQSGKQLTGTQVSAVISPGLANMPGGGIGAAALGSTNGGGPILASGGTVQAGGTATLHAGETIVPSQLAYLVALLGGDQAQQWVAAALHNGIETGASSDIHELAGGIGPAAGIFQFEPQTWLGNGGGAYAGTQPNGMSGASVATATQQAQVFVNATRGDQFGAWGPDLGYGYGAKAWPPAHGSNVANMIDSMFGQHFSNGGFVPGTGPVPAIVHGGEFVVSNAMLAEMGNGGSAASGGKGSGTALSINEGGIQVQISISGDATNVSANLQEEIENLFEEAFDQVMMKLNAGG